MTKTSMSIAIDPQLRSIVARIAHESQKSRSEVLTSLAVYGYHYLYHSSQIAKRLKELLGQLDPDAPKTRDVLQAVDDLLVTLQAAR